MPRSLLPCLVVLAFALPLPVPAQQGVPQTEDERILYTIGAFVAERFELPALGLSEDELAALVQGLQDAALERPAAVALDQYRPKLQEFVGKRNEAVYEKEVKASGSFLESESRRDGVVSKTSGMLYEELVAGTGASPGPESKVRVHYAGTLRDGRTFDSSIDRGKPAEFGVKGVIGCWTEALQLMKVGGRSRIYCPASIGYGKRGSPPLIKPGAALVFEIELLDIVN
jgi:FKBP-type peptidyl-prolyl cis-trans isomerase